MGLSAVRQQRMKKTRKKSSPNIRVYTGSEDLKERIEAAAEKENYKSVSAFLLRLFFKHEKTKEVTNG